MIASRHNDELSLPVEARASTTGTGAVDDCQIVPVGKRRDGGTRYWCLRHKADATAKYGRRASTCRVAHVPLVTERETLSLRLQEYPGGVALWGAVAPVYDTTNRRLDCGIHVHARVEVGSVRRRRTGPSAPCASSHLACISRVSLFPSSTQSTTWSARCSALKLDESSAHSARILIWIGIGLVFIHIVVTYAQAAANSSEMTRSA